MAFLDKGVPFLIGKAIDDEIAHGAFDVTAKIRVDLGKALVGFLIKGNHRPHFCYCSIAVAAVGLFGALNEVGRSVLLFPHRSCSSHMTARV